MNNLKKNIFLISSMLILILCFQNCSKNEFSADQLNSKLMNSDGITSPIKSRVERFKVVLDEFPMIGPNGGEVTVEIAGQIYIDPKSSKELINIKKTNSFLQGSHEETCLNEYVIDADIARQVLIDLNEAKIHTFDADKDPDVSIADAAIYSIYIDENNFIDANKIRLGKYNLKDGMKYTQSISLKNIEQLVLNEKAVSQQCKVTAQK